jgi:lysozyme
MKRVISLAGAVLVVAASAGPVRAQGVQGVDVSEDQLTIDWPQVKAAGIAFAFARVSDGTQHPDATFPVNWAGIKANGLVRGVYQYFRASEDPVAQADLLVASAGTFAPGDLIACDVETMDGVSAAQLLSNLAAWCGEIKAKAGRSPLIYCGEGFWDPLGGNFSGQDLWVASWFAETPSIPTGWTTWKFWQYTDQGSVPGIPARVDRDVWNGTLAQLVAYSPPANPGAPVATTAPATTAPVDTAAAGKPLLARGTSGEAVKQLQELLIAKGFDPGPVDGIFGPLTQAAVEAYQTDRQLEVDGIVGPQTWGSLDAPHPSRSKGLIAALGGGGP